MASDDAGLGGWLELGWLLDADACPRANWRENVLRSVVRTGASNDMSIDAKLDALRANKVTRDERDTPEISAALTTAEEEYV